jgi:hypothetical protein
LPLDYFELCRPIQIDLIQSHRERIGLTMKYQALKHLAIGGLLLLAASHALPTLAQLPKRDLIVEVREVEVGEGAAYTVGTQASKALLAPQQFRVRNGEKASLSVGKSMPMQWVQSASVQSAALAASGASASSNGAGVTQAVTWMNAGQRIQVQPRWPGSKQMVTVEVKVQSASVEPRVGAELPEQSQSQIETSVSAPMGQWVTIAFTGQTPQAGAYGSEAASDPRRLLQIRVLAP